MPSRGVHTNGAVVGLSTPCNSVADLPIGPRLEDPPADHSELVHMRSAPFPRVRRASSDPDPGTVIVELASLRARKRKRFFENVDSVICFNESGGKTFPIEAARGAAPLRRGDLLATD